MPAETGRHERTLMAWPTRGREAVCWPGLLDEARGVYAQVARAVAAHEPVTLVADPADAADASARCGGGVEVVPMPIDDSWFRDNGPVVVLAADGTRVALHFRFNAWGGKLPDHANDEGAGGAIAERLGLPIDDVPLVLEGGSIAVDGAGSLVTTERCLLNPNRNPELTREEIEAELAPRLGIERFVWLADAIAEDDGTDGHVDNVVAFTAPNRVLLQGCADGTNPNRAIAEDNRRRLEAAGIDVVDVPVLPYAAVGGRRVPVPYVNLYFANGVVVVPVTGHDADREMLDVVRAEAPDREIVSVPGALLALGGGGVHCITQQVPA